MSDAIRIVEKLLRESEAWRLDHKRAGRQIEAAGASIRIKAMKDVLEALQDPDLPPADEMVSTAIRRLAAGLVG